jgi:hypothetical protein
MILIRKSTLGDKWTDKLVLKDIEIDDSENTALTQWLKGRTLIYMDRDEKNSYYGMTSAPITMETM